MFKAIKPGIILLFLLAALPALGSSPVVVPDWVTSSASQAAKDKYPDETKAVVLLSQTKVTVVSMDEYVETNRRVVKILRPEGHDEAIFREWVEHNDKIENLHVWGIDPSGHNYEVKQKEFVQVSPYSEELYSDIRYFGAESPTNSPGSIVAFESTVRRRPWMAQLTWAIQEENPVIQNEFTLELPQGYEYSEAWANHADVKGSPAGPNEWHWSESSVAPFKDEPYHPHYAAIAPRMEIAYFGNSSSTNFASWHAIGTWYQHLAEGRRVASPALSDKTKELIAGKTSFDEKARAIADFVQRNIRYVEIQIGIGGYQPHYAADIFRNHYGDCKDKVTVMSTMLREAGISSEYVLVNTGRGVVKESVPAWDFNHAILAIQLPADAPASNYQSVVTAKTGVRYLIFDPTWEYTTFGYLSEEMQGNFGLLATAPGELLAFPVLKPDNNRLERVGKFSLGTDGSLKGDIVELMTGDHASNFRFELSNFDGAKRAKILEARVNASQKHATLGDPQFENIADINKDLLIKYKVTMENYAQKTGPLLLVRTRVMGDKALHLPRKDRTYPVEFHAATHDHDVYEIEVPSGYKIDDLPEPTHIDVGFASYDSKIEVSGNTIRYTRDYIVREPHVAVSHMNEIEKLENAIAKDEFASAVLTKAP